MLIGDLRRFIEELRRVIVGVNELSQYSQDLIISCLPFVLTAFGLTP